MIHTYTAQASAPAASEHMRVPMRTSLDGAARLVVARAADDEAHGERGDGAADGGDDGDDEAPVVILGDAQQVLLAVPLVAVVGREDDASDHQARRCR